MTNEEAIKEIQRWLNGCPYADTKEAFNLAIKALEEKTQGDLISREALKKALRQRQWHIDDIEEVMKIIDNAPTVSDRYGEGYAQGYIDGSTGADWKGGAE